MSIPLSVTTRHLPAVLRLVYLGIKVRSVFILGELVGLPDWFVYLVTGHHRPQDEFEAFLLVVRELGIIIAIEDGLKAAGAAPKVSILDAFGLREELQADG